MLTPKPPRIRPAASLPVLPDTGALLPHEGQYVVRHGFEDAPENGVNGVLPDLALALACAKAHVDSGYACGLEPGYTPGALYTVNGWSLWIQDDDGDGYVVIEPV